MTWLIIDGSYGTTDPLEISGWFALETALGESTPLDYEYGRELYGGCLEPGYQEQTARWLTECPECGRFRCRAQQWESAEGGSINTYWSESCDACGQHFTDWSEP